VAPHRPDSNTPTPRPDPSDVERFFVYCADAAIALADPARNPTGKARGPPAAAPRSSRRNHALLGLSLIHPTTSGWD
jgi:hypothetical protein